MVGLVLGILVTVVALALVACVFSVLGGVYTAALYRFATTGQAAGGFLERPTVGLIVRSPTAPPQAAQV